MPSFANYLQDLAQRRGWRRETDGARATYRIKLAGGVSLTLVSDVLDPGVPCRVMSEPWPIPTSEAAHRAFVREALRFNCNALHHLHCGVRRDPDARSQYRLMWEVPLSIEEADHWTAQLQLMGRLTRKAWDTLPRPGLPPDRGAPGRDDQHVIFMP